MKETRGEMGRATRGAAKPFLRLLAWLTVVTMVFGLLPAPALARAEEEMAVEGAVESAAGGTAPADGNMATEAGEAAVPGDGASAEGGAIAEHEPAEEGVPTVAEVHAAEDAAGEGVLATAEDAAPVAQSDEAAALSSQSLGLGDPRKASGVTTWDCVWFGSYPQTEVKPGDAAYSTLAAAGTYWDASGDATVGGARYRRISKDDATSSSYWSDDGYGSASYRYFKYEPIKWRVLKLSGDRALVIADVALDDRPYNTSYTNVTWETSSMRSWLNGYGASSNKSGTNYASKNFKRTAFPSDGAVLDTTVVNGDNIQHGTEGGNDTTDKVLLLSESEVYGEVGARHGFASDYSTYDEARRCKTSDYAHAMGARRETSTDYEGNCFWWLRSPGTIPYYAAYVLYGGNVWSDGNYVYLNFIAVRPALNLNLSSSLVQPAGTVSSDGSSDEQGPAVDPTVRWVSEGGSWYYYDGDGTWHRGWLRDGGAWYYLDPATGAMRTGWLRSGSTWYYLKSSGAMATGWAKVGSAWYYFASSGAMKTGWLKSGSAWYYLKSSGAMATGWAKVGSTWYYLNSSGAMKTGWIKLGSTWYYLSSSGAMVTGRQSIDGNWYTFSSSGAWVA